MAVLALVLLAILPPQPARGPAEDDDAAGPDASRPSGGEARAEAQQHDAGIASVPAAFLTLRIPLCSKKKKPDAAQK
ncbi:hypothetical protein [Sphingomonas sp.]|uniref:hypothetical protein n=1 Tax=Sphingomonas sp. TaxID=28214 RepID=UPI002FD9C632